MKLFFPPSGCATCAVAIALLLSQGIWAQETENPAEHEREELGLNPYTAPSVAEIFQQLDDLKPLPFEELKREFPQAAHASREQMGLVFGGLVADGFLIVECQKKNLVEDLGRVLLRQARSLGVGDKVMRHSASLTELGKNGDWPAVRQELLATQEEVEQAMIDLRDQRMAHLISLEGSSLEGVAQGFNKLIIAQSKALGGSSERPISWSSMPSSIAKG